MDLVTQGILGATFAQSFSSKKSVKLATLAGFLGGLAADADGFIRSSTDSLLAIQFHRHFTHSLLFIPVGALIVSIIVWLILRRRESFKTIYIFSFLGYATHGVLDACTSYGTRLLWPFSNERIAWDNIAIIDPFFTLPLLAAMLWVLRTKNIRVVRVVLALCIGYLLLGVVQRDRAINEIKKYAASEADEAYQIQAKPTFGQLILWKTIYKTKNEGDETFHVNAIRLGLSPLFETKVYEGETSPVLNVKHYTQGLPRSVLYNDILRFQDFSSDMLILVPGSENVIGDARYSMLPNQIKPLWGIQVDLTKQDQHATFKTFRNVGDRDWKTLWSMIRGQDLKD